MTGFFDRATAGRALAAALTGYARRDDVLVLGLPRGGVPVAAAVAEALGSALDIMLVHKLAAPGEPELAIGAIGPGGAFVVNQNILSTRASAADVHAEIVRQRAELERRENLYRSGRLPLAVAGRIAILVDDGAATGATMLAAVRAARKLEARRIVVAVPVASAEALDVLRAEADEVTCLSTPPSFRSVGEWYEHFEQTSDAEVSALLAGVRHDRTAGSVRTASEPLRG